MISDTKSLLASIGQIDERIAVLNDSANCDHDLDAIFASERAGLDIYRELLKRGDALTPAGVSLVAEWIEQTAANVEELAKESGLEDGSPNRKRFAERVARRGGQGRAP